MTHRHGQQCGDGQREGGQELGGGGQRGAMETSVTVSPIKIYKVEYYATTKKKEILPSVTAWMDLERIMLSEISQSEKDKNHMISLKCGIFF